MRACGLLTAIPIGLMLTASQAKTTPAETSSAPAKDSCGPTYMDIYDFQVGDVFEGEQTIFNDGVGSSAFYLAQKYRIISRETLPGGYRYHIEGVTRRYETDYGFGPVKISPMYYGTVSETWDFADSTARKALNACRDQIVRFPEFGGPYAAAGFDSGNRSSSGYFTRVGIPAEDTAFPLSGKPNSLKTFGSTRKGPPSGNLYMDSALKVASYYQLWAVYAAGLGLVRVTSSQFESGMNFELKGYIRNGITYGLVEEDNAFSVPISIRLQPAGDPARSRALRFSGSGNLFIYTNGISILDMLGRQARTLRGHPIVN